MGNVFNRFKSKKRTTTRAYKAHKERGFTERTSESMLFEDLYAEPINLNFKGRKTFQSTAGIIISFLVRVSLLLFFITRGLGLLQLPIEGLMITE